MIRVEFLRALEDHSWDIVSADIDEAELDKRTDAGDDDQTLQAWAREHLMPLTIHRKAVLFAVLEVHPCG